MNRSFRGWFEGVRNSAIRGVTDTPIEVLIGVATALVLSFAVDSGDSSHTDFAVHFGLVALPTLLAVFATSTLHRVGVVGRSARWALTAGYLAVGGVYGLLVLDIDQSAELWRWGSITASLGLAALLAPLAARSLEIDPRDLAWRFALRLGTRTAISVAYAVLLYGGISLGIGAFIAMFELQTDGEVFGHLAAWIFVAGLPWMIASGLPRCADTRPGLSQKYLERVRMAGIWLVTPLTALYMLVLYAYGARLLVTGDAPSNLLSPLSLGAAMLGLVAMYVLEPLERRGDDWLTKLWNKFPLAYLPLLPMPAWAIWQRIEQYGWTEFRYFRLVALLGLLACFGWASWKTLRSRSYSATGMPAVFALIFFFASFGPWGATGVSYSSQVAELRAAAERDGEEAKDQVWERLEYLHGHFGDAALQPVVPDDARPVHTPQDACTALGSSCAPPAWQRERRHVRLQGPPRIPEPGTLRTFDVWDLSSKATAGPWDIRTEKSAIVLTRGDVRAEIDLSELVADLRRGDPPNGAKLSSERLTFRTVAPNGEELVVVIQNLQARFGRSMAPEIVSVEGWLLQVDG